MNDQSMAMSEDECWHLIRQIAFSSFSTPDLQISYLPFAFKQPDAALSHFARSNPHWKNINQTDCLISILGPHAFISTNCYESKPAVSTWNYACVNIWGTAQLMNESETQSLLDDMLDTFEPALKNDKHTFPDIFRRTLAEQIVGVKIEINNIRGRLKLGQHKKLNDQFKVHQTLKTGSLDEQNYAEFSKQWLKKFRNIDI